MILTVTLNPAVDNAWFLERLCVHDANRAIRVDRDAGGKGINLSRVVAELGGRTLATGYLGGPTGEFIRCILEEQGVEQDFVWTGDETRLNFSVEDESKAPPTTFNAPGPQITTAEWQSMLATLERQAPNAHWVALAGSLPRGVAMDAYATLGQIALSQGARLAVDADGAVLAEAMKVRPHFIKPNENEASRLLGREVSTTQEALLAAKDLRRLVAEDGIVVVSRGGKGAVMATADGCWVGTSPEVEVKSTMGSGDSMIAGILWALEEGQSAPEAFAWGLASGAATASTDGTKIACRAAIAELVTHAGVAPASV